MPPPRTAPILLGLLLFAFVAAARAQAFPQQPEVAPGQPSSMSASEKEVAQEEEKGENAYRHSKLVKAAARAMHMSVESTARTFEIINIAIVVVALGIPLVRMVPRILRNRSEKLSNDIESARKETADANSRLSAVEEKLKHLDEEIAKYRAQIESEMHQDEARIKVALEEETARIVTSAEQEIGVAAAQARRGLRNFAAGLAIEQASQQLNVTPETDRALIGEFVSGAAKGGSN